MKRETSRLRSPAPCRGWERVCRSSRVTLVLCSKNPIVYELGSRQASRFQPWGPFSLSRHDSHRGELLEMQPHLTEGPRGCSARLGRRGEIVWLEKGLMGHCISACVKDGVTVLGGEVSWRVGMGAIGCRTRMCVCVRGTHVCLSCCVSPGRVLRPKATFCLLLLGHTL